MNINEYERTASKADLKDTINLPIAVPVWGVLVALVSSVYFGGLTVGKLNTVIENSAKTEARLEVVTTKQTEGLADAKILHASVDDIKVSVSDLKARVAFIELRRK